MAHVTRRDVLRGAAGVAGLALLDRFGFAQSSVATKPNVLFISADDLNPHLGCYGNKVVQTPSIDRLAAGAVRFEHAYAQYPSCLPSRASFLSGWHPQRTGVYDFNAKPRDGRLKDVTYLGQHFRNNGYQSMRLDKVFHVGVDDAESWEISEEPEPSKPPVFLADELKELKLLDRVAAKGRYDHVKGERGPYFAMDVADDQLYVGMTPTQYRRRYSSG
jgi:iduronate 2-sulfatase